MDRDRVFDHQAGVSIRFLKEWRLGEIARIKLPSAPLFEARLSTSDRAFLKQLNIKADDAQ